ncbi:Dihydropteroate synthase [Caenispirillum salinarum AK4]|uniref:dihydropteroate synthase n=1 Tax=Caenispirillum salinarum AK4 TaxID=1238182 RepID=K9GZE4_9PROT|nr:Dihydropteroate synthase [Caenispirillum salinarum AK4]
MSVTITPSITESPALARGFSLPEGADPASMIHLAPAGLLTGAAARAAVEGCHALPLAGREDMAFALLAVLIRKPGGGASAVVAPEEAVTAWAEGCGEAVAAHVAATLDRLTAPRPAFAGLSMDRPRIMGILNITPDSFSDGGDRYDPSVAIADGLAMMEAGADILDVGGESTRPGSDPVPPEEEIRRVVPVVRGLAEKGAVVSIDTRNAATMEAAVTAGARIVNDVTALTWDPNALPTVAKLDVPVVLMHIKGTPQTMQKDPVYDCAPLDVADWLRARAEQARAAGVEAQNICLDPGIGFGKTLGHNLEILAWSGVLHGLGHPVLLGLSRKSFIGRLSRGEAPKERLPGTVAADQSGLDRGLQILRVHDVPEAVQAVATWRGIGSV